MNVLFLVITARQNWRLSSLTPRHSACNQLEREQHIALHQVSEITEPRPQEETEGRNPRDRVVPLDRPVQHAAAPTHQLDPLAASISKVRACWCPREDSARLVESQVSLRMPSIASHLVSRQRVDHSSGVCLGSAYKMLGRSAI